MFRCTSAPIIKEFPQTLSDWNFTLSTSTSEILDSQGEFFNYFETDNERFNDLRHETFQALVREEIAAELRSKYDVRELFLTGPRGAKIVAQKPDGERYVTILATEGSKLKRKRDVVVVVGETSQDAGIWAWRFVQREGGLMKGSVVGLAEKLKRFGEGKREEGVENGEGRELSERRREVRVEKYEEKIPGLVVLNPGQLLYSPQLNKNMTLTSWNKRPRETLLSDPYDIDPHYNRVPGHEDDYHHLHLTLEHILHQLLSPIPPRLHILALGSGTLSLLDSLDQILLNKHELQVRGGDLASIALISPQHDPGALTSEKLTEFLQTQGKAWVQSEEGEKKGTLLAKPTAGTNHDLGLAFELVNATTTTTHSLTPRDEISAQHREQVSCMTFSAGIADGVVETILPEVMDDVLAHFFAAIEAGCERDAREGVEVPREYYD